MHPTLETIKRELDQLAAQVKTGVPNNEPLNVAHNNWSFSGLTRDELYQIAIDLAEMIDTQGTDELAANEALLADYPRRLVTLRTQTIAQIWGNAANAVPAYLLTLSALEKALKPAFGESNDEAQRLNKELNQLRRQVRAIEAGVADIEPKTANLSKMVDRILEAHETADQLPADLELLKEKRRQIQELHEASSKDGMSIGAARNDAQNAKSELEKIVSEAEAIIERCEEAYRATTSQGLASAFADRAKELNQSVIWWVCGLIGALAIGGTVGTNQLHALAETIKSADSKSDFAIWIQLVLAVLSIGGSVWFGWIATKQIGQRFRLAEDYGYKASISKAYEGYRREAKLVDPAFQSKLFASALTRLDELPLRLVEPHTHGSPIHEALTSETVQKAINIVPGFVGKIEGFAKDALTTFSKVKPEPSAPKDSE